MDRLVSSAEFGVKGLLSNTKPSKYFTLSILRTDFSGYLA